MPAEFDDLSRRLTDLESDVAQARMPGPAAARRRGRQRTRNRATAVALGSAAAIVVGIGALDAIPQATPAPDPVDSPSPVPEPSPSRTPDPGPITEEPDPLADLLVTPEDLADLASPWGDIIWTDRPREAALQCSPAGPDSVRSADVGFEAARTAEPFGELLAWADESIYAFASVTEADAAMTALRDQLGQCATDRDDVELTRTWEYDGLGDAAFQSEVLPEQLGRGVAAGIGAARTGSTLVVTVSYLYMEGEFNGQSDLLAAAVSKACDGACVGEISSRQTYPAGDTDDVFLLDDDVNPIGAYTDFVRSDLLTSPLRYESFCLGDLVYQDAQGQPSSEPVQAGGEAPTIYQAEWFGPSEGSVYETVIQFPDAESAAAYVAGHEVLPEQCGDIVETHEQVVNQPTPAEVSGADEALVWTIDETVLPTDPGSEGGFSGVGLARSGDVVVVIGFGAFGDPTTGTGGTWADYATQTLALAIGRAQS